LKEKLLFCDWWECRPDHLLLAACFFEYLLSPDVQQGEGVSAKKGKKGGTEGKERGSRVFIFFG